MASSKVMASSSSANSDLTRQPSTYSLSISELQTDQGKNFGSMSMDDLIRNIYGENPPAAGEVMCNNDAEGSNEISLSRQESFSLPRNAGGKTVEEVWKEISSANGASDADGEDRKVIRDSADGQFAAEMTLEEFLTKTGTLREEDVKIPAIVGPVHGFVVDPALDSRFPPQQGEGSILWLGNGVERPGGRGKRRAVLEPIDKVAQQRQRRMIKNRESAARSRERKQVSDFFLRPFLSFLFLSLCFFYNYNSTLMIAKFVPQGIHVGVGSVSDTIGRSQCKVTSRAGKADEGSIQAAHAISGPG